MLLAEPPASAWDLHFRLLGIPVRIHPWFWLVAVLLVGNSLMQASSPQAILAILVPWAAAFLIGILFHELGHAVAMRAYGRSPKITLYGFGGLTSSGYEGLYASRGFTALGEILIAAAGPGAGFLLAGVVVVLCNISGSRVEFSLGGIYGFDIGFSAWDGPLVLGRFVLSLLYISIYWGLINLLPIYPLDGGQIARELLVRINPRQGVRQSLLVSMMGAAVLAAVGLLLWQDLFVALLFGYLAYTSYMTLQAYEGRR